MKRPLQLSLAIALALGVTDAFALGLGAIQVRSGLNQPLIAEIPVVQSAPGEAEGLLVQLASAEDFERVGMNRTTVGVPLEFALGKNARGEPVIRITSKDIVREPFLGLLVEANWPKGRLLREYTVLLDPPVMAPAVKGSSAVAVATREPERAATEKLPESKPAPVPAAKPVTDKPIVARSEPAPKAPAAPRQASGTEYGPVAAGETLGEIARATRPSDSVSVNQMMLALLKSNPGSFYRDNINALKRGAVLRVPSSDEISAAGSARDAAASVRSQIDEWRGSSAAAPTLVADTSAAPAPASKPESKPSATTGKGERLALVPPREGKAGEQAADRPGAGSAGGTGDAATKAELARVKEALTSREQESGELKSRVKDLEEIKGKNDKLLTLQNSELAELRNKLKALQDAASKPASSSVAAAPVAVPPQTTMTPSTPAASSSATPPATDPKISKEDIWGDGDKATASKPPVASSSTPPPVVEPLQPPSTPVTTTPPPVTETPPPAVTELKPPSDPVVASAPPVVEPSKPADTEVKPATPLKPPVVVATPVVSETPWYLEPWALGVAGVGGLLLVLLGVNGMRKRRVIDATVARPSIAESFGDSPLGESFSAIPVVDAEEEQLIDQVRRDPGNAGAHLELLSLYYAQRDGDKFEAAAEEMYAYVADPNQAEWREARSMGEDLVPHNPLFGGASDLSGLAGGDLDPPRAADEFSFDEPTPRVEGNYEPYRFDEPEIVAPGTSPFATTTMPAVDFDFEPSKPAAARDEAFSFDLPPLEPVTDPPIVTEYDLEPEEPESVVNDDEFFAGEDAIGTKLDLAKAYLDMGDPDGARAMLEEVLAEGSPTQQDEARKLISEIR